MTKFIDLTSKTFGRLTILKRIENNKYRQARWSCLCSCDNIIPVNSGNLISGHTQSCGCLRLEKAKEVNTSHGMRNHPAYKVWSQIKARCSNEKNKRYGRYGGRGISVCERWKASFKNFWTDMGATYKQGLSIDRIDNDGNYTPGNCRWATQIQQNNNRRINKNNASGYRGVSWNKGRSKWCAYVEHLGKTKHLGLFSDKTEAAKVRDSYIKENNLPAQLNFR